MQGFARTVGRSMHIRPPSTTPSRASMYGSGSTSTLMGDTQLFRELRGSKGRYRDDVVPLHELFPVLRACTAPLRAAVATVLADTRTLLESVNKRRYARGSNAHTAECLAALDASAARLDQALDAFRTTERLALLEPFAPYLRPGAEGEEGELPKASAAPFRALFISYVFAANLVAVTTGVRALVQSVSRTAHLRPKNRFWAPGAIALGRVLGRRGRGEDDVGQAALGEAPQVSEGGEWEREEEVYRESVLALSLVM